MGRDTGVAVLLDLSSKEASIQTRGSQAASALHAPQTKTETGTDTDTDTEANGESQKDGERHRGRDRQTDRQTDRQRRHRHPMTLSKADQTDTKVDQEMTGAEHYENRVFEGQPATKGPTHSPKPVPAKCHVQYSRRKGGGSIPHK